MGYFTGSLLSMREERESWRQKHIREFLFSLLLKRDIGKEEKGGGGGGESN